LVRLAAVQSTKVSDGVGTVLSPTHAAQTKTLIHYSLNDLNWDETGTALGWQGAGDALSWRDRGESVGRQVLEPTAAAHAAMDQDALDQCFSQMNAAAQQISDE
jgi:hypothetical protein